jgi:hypothetical protein
MNAMLPFYVGFLAMLSQRELFFETVAHATSTNQNCRSPASLKDLKPLATSAARHGF